MDIEQLYRIYLQHPEICTDTRKINPGCLFFALKGDNFDGNQFAEQALSSGAAYAVVENSEFQINDHTILVNDVLQTLQQLARYHRSQLQIPFIGITGTNGKTTTKELIKSVLSTKFVTYATLGNLNNHIGVPLTLLSITNETEIAIIEMGANHQKEIEFLCSIANPQYGIITNVGKAHLEGFGGFEGVKKGKGELYEHLKQNSGMAFVNHENNQLMEMVKSRSLDRVTYYGETEECLVQGHLVDNDPFLTVEWLYDNQAYLAKSNLTGTYNTENILASIAIGLYFKLQPEEINKGIEAYVPTNNRSQLIKTNSNTLICDYYNANPSSMQVALANFSSVRSSKKVVILADMFELGNESEAEHKAILEQACQVEAEAHIFIGQEFYKWSSSGKGTFYRSTDDAYAALELNPIKDAYILIKGSRGMKLEKLAELF